MNRAVCVLGITTALAFGPGFPYQTQNTSPSISVEEMRQAFYAYDASLPLNPELKKMPEESEKLAELRTRYHLIYDSVHDQRVTAILALPKKFAPPFPAVILVAGAGGHKNTDYLRLTADMFSSLGYATLSVDAQYHGERKRPGRTGDIHLIDSYTNRDAWVQTVIDLRRAVDYLASRPDIDAKKIGYIGFSQGGILGATFLGVEPRVKAACLAVSGGGFVEWAKQRKIWETGNAHAFRINAAITDPIYFIGRFAPRPLLMLSAKRDELIPREATMRLFHAAKQPKKLVWFNSGHILPLDALFNDARHFFEEHLGTRKGIKEK